MKQAKIRQLEASDERQYLLNDSYEVYEKVGAPTGASAFHYHSFFEIIYVLEGEYSSMVENQIYNLKKGDFLLIDSNIMHKYNYVEAKHENSKRIILWVAKEMLDKLSDGSLDLSGCFRHAHATSCAFHFPIYYEEMLRGFLIKLAMDEIPDVPKKGAKEVLDRAFLTQFFVYLNMLCGKKEYLFSEEEYLSDPMVELISGYIDEHIRESISVEDLAECAHMSKYHFLRRFKELTGVTAHTFVNNKRLIKAAEELKKGRRIAEVCEMTGFTEYSSFLRNFKKTFGVSPGKYKDFY